MGGEAPKNRGRSSPVVCFARAKFRSSRTAHPLSPAALPFTEEVNGMVNETVICVFHATFTRSLALGAKFDRCWGFRIVSKKTLRPGFIPENSAHNLLSLKAPESHFS